MGRACTAGGGDGDDQLYGEAGSDNADGGSGNDRLDGGAGADRLAGGLGDDIYIVDNAADVIVERQGEGEDWVFSSVDFTMSPGAYIEVLSTTWADGTAPLNLTANDLGNSVYGNAGNNVLNGGGGNDQLVGGAGNDTLNGGAGIDHMVGGVGNDLYMIDNAADTVTELISEGEDWVFSGVDYVMTAGAYIEVLATNWADGTAPIDLTANDLGNSVYGNAGANILNGGGGNDQLVGGGGNDSLNGGLGADNLNGGTGADNFLFDAIFGAGNVDHILDFVVGEDKIQLEDSLFSALSAGTLSPDAFALGTTAADADDRIIYDSASGNLFYDADGSGAGAAVLFAAVTAGTELMSTDFAVI